MSSISAGTTTTTGYVVSSDTTGALVLKTGASSTTAVTIDTSQNVTFTGSQTISGGTANGVTYLNGSKVLTSGSALTFDGSLFNVTTSGTTSATIRAYDATASKVYIQAGGASPTAAYVQLGVDGSNGTSYLNDYYGSGLVFQRAGTEAMRLTSTGLGIGTSSPDQALVVNKASGSTYLKISGANNAGLDLGLQFTDGTNTSYFGQLRGTLSGTAGALVSVTGGAIRTVLDASGNLGVGTTSPINNSGYGGFSLNGTSGALLSMMTGGTESSRIASIGNETSVQCKASTGYITFVQGVSGGTERARIDSSGNLLVNSTSTLDAVFSVTARSGVTACSLRVATNGDYGYTFKNESNTFVGAIGVNSSSTSYVTSSDYRLKNTIAPMTGALAKVALLKPVTYKWNVDGSDSQGFIAHELAEVVPECVTGEKDAVDANGNPKYQGIDTSFLVATLTSALQELNAKFDAYVASHP
jgi:hypothetical protein